MTELPGGYSLPTWQQHARRDDCLERMVPSDLRQFLGLIERQQQVIDLLMKAVEPFAKGPEQCFPGSSSEIPVTLSVGSHYMVNYLRVGDLRRAREAKVEADRILSPREKTDD